MYSKCGGRKNTVSNILSRSPLLMFPTVQRNRVSSPYYLNFTLKGHTLKLHHLEVFQLYV